MWINVILLVTGKKLTLKVESCITIRDLKATMEDMEGIPAFNQRFVNDGLVLREDRRTLGDYNIRNNSTLYMVLRMGGPPHIYVKTFSGNSICVESGSSDTVHNIKAKVEEKEGIPLDKQSLFFAGKQLEDTHTLADYGLASGSILRVVQLSDATADDDAESGTASLTTICKANPNTYEDKLKACALHQAKATEVINELKSEVRPGVSSSVGSELEDLKHQMTCKRKEFEATVSKLAYKNKAISAWCAYYEGHLAARGTENKKIKLEVNQGIENYLSSEQGQASLEGEKAKWLKSVEFLDHLTEGALQYFEYGFESCQKQAEQQGFVGQLNKDAALQEAPELKGSGLSEQP